MHSDWTHHTQLEYTRSVFVNYMKLYFDPHLHAEEVAFGFVCVVLFGVPHQKWSKFISCRGRYNTVLR